MFDIIIHPPIAEFDGTNILLACLAGHLTIFAFGYPYIYRAINNLSNISTILTERAKNNKCRNYYSKIVIGIFILNLIALHFSNKEIASILSCIFLLFHILYIMVLYQIIENVTIDPFKIVINKDAHNTDFTIQVPSELENDITLIIDLICYYEKSTHGQIDESNYFIWLINAAIFKLKKINTSEYDPFIGFKPDSYKTLFSTLYKVQWLNQWAVDQKKTTLLYYIEEFYLMLLEYGVPHSNNIDYSKFPILNTIDTIDKLNTQYSKTNNIDTKTAIQNKCNFIKYVQKKVLEYFEQVYRYRIINHCIMPYDMGNFIELLYFVLQRKINKDLKCKYEPYFKIITQIIDCDYSDEYYQEMIDLIKKHSHYFWGKTNVYKDICQLHISVMAYLIFKNKYQTLKTYMYYEEPKERINQHTRPQIPNSIDSILWNFIGHDSVFQTTQTFSVNTSSYKYKFYILFLLLTYSKQFADNYKENLSKLNNDDWRYKYTKNNIKFHTKCSIDFQNMDFDILMLYHSIENYREFFEKFKKETELLNLFEFDREDEQFITWILYNTIKQIKQAQNNLLKCQFKNIALKKFSIIKQEELGCETLDEFINLKINKFLETIKSMSFKEKDDNLLKKISLSLYENTFSKRKLLSGGYSYLFAGEPNKDFYSRLFSLIIKDCQEIDDIKNIPSNIENYEILSNFEYKRNFENFGFNKADIKVKTTTVNGVKTDDFEHADVSSVIIKNKEIKISQCNDNFHFLNINETDSHLLILFNPEKISIKVGNNESIKYEDLNDCQVKIINDTQITISIPKDKSLGYYILNTK